MRGMKMASLYDDEISAAQSRLGRTIGSRGTEKG
jgi:hypothetical protein